MEVIVTTPEALAAVVRAAVAGAMKERAAAAVPPEFLTPKEASKRYKTDVSTLSRWVKDGRLPKYQTGRKVLYRTDEIERALNRIV